MNTTLHRISPALALLALAGLTGTAHAAWGHSDYTHVEAYQQQHTPDAWTSHRKAVGLQHDYGMIRAFERDFGEEARSRARKAQGSGSATRS